MWLIFKLKKNRSDLGYEGTFYIDVNSLALISADYALDLKNINKAKDFLVKRKPSDITVYPIKAEYHIDYTNKGNKWYYSYGNLELSFRIKKKRKLFNTVYSLSSENGYYRLENCTK